ncbi:MAG TPA: RNA polymerase sigma factor [Candidatus Binatus sp.]|nr:RNA polymerase sigma factor [Candidatus Binatus sp.]
MAVRFETLIENHHDEIFTYLWRLLGGQRCADVGRGVEDLVQDVFMRAYEAFPNLRPDSNHRAWLYKIATHRAFTKLRRAKLQREKFALLKNSQIAHSIFTVSVNNAADLRAAIEQLTPKQKACVTLRYFNDLDYAAIAVIVGCSALSARANVSHALRQLGKIMKESV